MHFATGTLWELQRELKCTYFNVNAVRHNQLRELLDGSREVDVVTEAGGLDFEADEPVTTRLRFALQKICQN